MWTVEKSNGGSDYHVTIGGCAPEVEMVWCKIGQDRDWDNQTCLTQNRVEEGWCLIGKIIII